MDNLQPHMRMTAAIRSLSERLPLIAHLSISPLSAIGMGLFGLMERMIREGIFANIFAFLDSYVLSGQHAPAKRELFASLSENRRDPASNDLRMVEIGFGSGANLVYYPAGTRLVCVEPNPTFREKLSPSEDDRFAHLASVEAINATAEDMPQIPSNSVDVVVSSYCLCYVTSQAEALQEIKRVLRPGGRFYYFEHIKFDADERPVMRSLQKMAAPVWRYISCGCNFRGPVHLAVSEAGLELEWYTTRSNILHGPVVPLLMWTCLPHEYGVAVKPSPVLPVRELLESF